VEAMDTERLTLRPFTLDDTDIVIALLNDTDFLRFVGDRHVRTADDARMYLVNGPLDSYAKHGFGLYAVELKTGRMPVGMCGLLQRATLPDPDIGFAFLPTWRSQGLAEEAARAVLEKAREQLQLPRLLAIVDPANERSSRLLRKLGMHFLRFLPADPEGCRLACYGIDFHEHDAASADA
jgi:[ribosomal protein S5]-alanine N-acetyltransferase